MVSKSNSLPLLTFSKTASSPLQAVLNFHESRWSSNPPWCSCSPCLKKTHLHFPHTVLAHLLLSLLTFFCPCSPSSVLAHLLLSLLTFFCPCSPSSALAHLLLSLLTFFCPCSPSSVLAHLLLSLLTFFCPCSPSVLDHLSLLTLCP